MKMKFKMVLFCLLIIGLVGCSTIPETEDVTAEDTSLYIEKANFNKEENDLIKLVCNSTLYIFSYHLDDKVSSANIIVYEMVDGEWTVFSRLDDIEIIESESKFAVGFDDLGEELRFSILGNGSRGYTVERELDLSDLNNISSVYDAHTEIKYGEEILIATQAFLAEGVNSVRGLNRSSFGLDDYNNEDFVKVYAMTIVFNKKAGV